MYLPSHTELLEQLEELILVLQEDENRFYVAIDLAHQLREELSSTLDIETDSE